MTVDPRSVRTSRVVPAESVQGVTMRLPLSELDRVSVKVEVRGDDGEIVPAGSTGTVVAVWSEGEAFDVEFTKPVEALATVKAAAIGAVQSRRR